MTTTRIRSSARAALVGVTSLAVATVGTIAAAGVAAADPDLDRVQARVEQVSERVDDLYREAETANERFLGAQERLRKARAELQTSRAAVRRQSLEVDEMTAEVGGFAAAAYRQGVVDSELHLMLSDSVSEALTQNAVFDTYADQQVSSLAAVAAERTVLAQQEAEIEEKAAAIKAIKQEMAEEKAALNEKVDAAEDLLASLEEKERRLLAKIEAERQRRAEAAARAAEREAAEEAAERAAAEAAAPDPEPQPVAPPASGRGGSAASFALGQTGDGYAYGGVGPSAWDCSGLTSGAWAAAGVSIPRTSQGQFYGLPRVSLSALQPGDIVAYYGGASHVGVYIGNGQIVHASRPGRPVSVAPLYSMPVVGAVRPG